MAEPSRAAEVRLRGGAIGRTLGMTGPIYDTSVKNMRAAQAAVVDIDFLEGDELLHQWRRVQDLLDAASEQQRLIESARLDISTSGGTEDCEKELRDAPQTSTHNTSASRSGRHHRTTTAGNGVADEPAGDGRV